VEKKHERYTETITRCDDFLEKYPKGKYAKEIKQIRRNSEQELKTLKKHLRVT